MKSHRQQHKGTTRSTVIAVSLLILLSRLSPSPATGENFTSYQARTEFLPSSPSSSYSGLYGYVNPAMVTYVDDMEMLFTWSDDSEAIEVANDWGFYMGLPHLGFGVTDRPAEGGGGYKEYRLAVAGGDRSHSVGLAYGWANGSHRPPNQIILGTLIRPNPSLSAGLTLTSALSKNALEYAANLSLRPLGTDRLTLFGTAVGSNDGADDQKLWSAGAAIAAVPGLSFSAGYGNHRTVSANVHVSLGSVDFWTQTLHDRRDSSHRHGGEFVPHRHAAQTRQTYAVRVGGHRANLLSRLSPTPNHYLDVDLNGPLNHRRFPLFDQSRTLAGLLITIRRAQGDPEVNSIAINTSGMRMSWEKAWEVRRALREFRQSGKRVVIYADRLDLRGYHLASVADRLILDPTGLILLEGFVAGQTYYSAALEKIGVGVEEWRYFKYKAALEALTREQMSDADREQWQTLLDDFYALARDEIIADRSLTVEQFDELMDETVVLLPSEAVVHGLVDTLGRPEDLPTIIGDWAGDDPVMIEDHAYRPIARDVWGEPPRIAVVYALGMCAMDSGIRARTLVKDIEAAVEDRHVKAVVLRIDSPGGDALASDRVAEAVRQGREHKPFVISQGSVAASGGYWLSMYGDEVIAAPNTVTGSIGVIGGWIYNQGLKEKLALTTDHVQVGRHADAAFGMSLPLIGVQLPDRNLNETEKARVEHVIRTTYDQFVSKVADGRERTPEEIDQIAQGRIWSGTRALDVGLVDRLGGLDVAINVAKKRAGIEGVTANIVEYPRLSLFDADLLRPQLLGMGNRTPGQLEAGYSASDYWRFRLERNGEPLLLMPMDQALRLGD